MKEVLNRAGFSRFKLFAALVFIYVVLFEYILPANQIVPKPSLILDSFGSLWDDYNLFYAFAFTVSGIYLGMLGSVLLIALLKTPILKFVSTFAESVALLDLFKYISIFAFIILFSFWMKFTWFSELIFIFAFVLVEIMSSLTRSVRKVNPAYVDSANSILDDSSAVFGKVIWKDLMPSIFSGSSQIHLRLWTAALVFEFVNKNEGLGGIFSLTFNYNDFAGSFSLILITSALIFIGDKMIGFLKSKIIFWES